MNLRRTFAAASLALLVAGSTASCESYDSPPRPELVGLTSGALSNPASPIVISFSEPVVAESVRIIVAPLVTDIEGNLADEDDDSATVLNEFFTYDGKDPFADDARGQAVLSEDKRSLSIALQQTLPVGPSLVVIIEAGLSDAKGNVTETRQRLVFGYEFSCDDAGGTELFPSGVYYILMDVETPLATQIQLWSAIDVDPATGRFVGQFTNADRNPDPGRCSPACDSTEVCRTLPAQECVIPSTKAGTEDEYPDFLPNVEPPTGYTFTVEGCVAQDGDVVRFANLAADVDIQVPDIFVKGIQIVASFGTADDGVFRGTGSGIAEQVFLGITPSGAANGTVVARLVPEDEVPAGVPPAPAEGP